MVGAAPGGKCGTGRWGMGKEGYPIMSLSATVRPSTITGVWSGGAPSKLSSTPVLPDLFPMLPLKSNKEQMQPLAPTLTLRTDNELEHPEGPSSSQGAPILPG